MTRALAAALALALAGCLATPAADSAAPTQQIAPPSAVAIDTAHVFDALDAEADASAGRTRAALAAPDQRPVVAVSSAQLTVPALRSSHLPDDPMIARQADYFDAIHASAAWERRIDGSGVIVAVVDTGVDTSHPDLAGQIYRAPASVYAAAREAGARVCGPEGCTFVASETADASCGYATATASALVEDDNGHGTFVAGVIAATANNGTGISGIASGVQIMPVKVLDCGAGGRSSAAAAGIRYAARSGATIIVAAFGGAMDSRPLREAVAEAIDRYGVLVIAAAGNDATSEAQYPASYPGVLSVGGTGGFTADGSIDYGRLAPFSNVANGVGLLAPAVGLVGPVPPGVCTAHRWNCLGGSGYARSSGTSFAAPLVAGAAALLYAEHPELTPSEAIALLTATGTHSAHLPVVQLDIARVLAMSANATASALSSSTEISHIAR